MFEFKHPKYYTELRKRNKALRSCDAYSKENSNYTERQQSDQVISKQQATASSTRAPGPGLKPQATSASSYKLSNFKQQASSDKQQASSCKPQATSSSITFPS